MKKLKYLLFAGLLMFAVGCTDDDSEVVEDTKPAEEEPIVEEPIEDPAANYVKPTYADDYASISLWGNRSSWNLANVHDPSVVFDGTYYYMYGTDASYGNVHAPYGHFPYRRSKDLVNWEFRGMTMTATPAWVKDTLNHIRLRNGLAAIENPVFGHWAPVVRKVGDKYRMYYSVIVDNYIKTGKSNTVANYDNSWTEHAFIGLCETSDLQSNIWTDLGMVVCSSTDRGLNWSRGSRENDWSAYFKWNAIDPTYQVTPGGEHYLIYGSWHSGIVSLKLDAATGKPANELNALADYGTRIARRVNNDANRWQAQEGPEIIYNEKTGYYYLFLAYDELSVAYNTRVCRSKDINGPYLGINGANVTQGADCWPIITHPYKFNNHSGWVGFAHCAVFQNEATGDWFYTSQARLPANTNGNAYSNAIMMGHVRKIRWTDDGWPVVMPERYTAYPEVAITEDELVGQWENITLNYQYQTMQTSTPLTLTSDKKATGALSGTWSFDAVNKVLTIGTQKLCVERELDWEASPRSVTLVYSGLNANGRSLWGKKVVK
ncbi:MAG: arabinan endo-1,5-alpha-L-arabinosidase [Marinilabiliaceae bacterium]|nr:arabinan endo-1,5-alpha-L-arabinosidase [Marinilabiliaceae bacterium]